MNGPALLGSAVIGAVIAAVVSQVFELIRDERQRAFERGREERQQSFERENEARRREEEIRQLWVADQRKTLDQLQHALAKFSSSSMLLVGLRHMPPKLWTKDGQLPLETEWHRELMRSMEEMPVLTHRVNDAELQDLVQKLSSVSVRIAKENSDPSQIPDLMQMVAVPLHEAQKRAGDLYRSLGAPS